jgi:beta-galactosidase
MKATQPTLDWLYDPRVFQINRLDACSDHAVYANAAEADSNKSSLTQSLNGVWKLHYAPDLEGRIEGFEAADFDASGWADISVPGCLELSGYGTPHYVNVQYPWDGWEPIAPPQLPSKNPVAEYVTEFDLPDGFAGKRVVLSFDGAVTALYAWVNGVFLGYAEDGFTPSHFDATFALKPGKNRLAIRLFRYSTASWLEDQDFWRFSGLIRGVHLTAQPEVRASRRAGEVRDLDYEVVAADLARRDALDQDREHSPLTQAEDAVTVDTTDRGIDQIVDEIMRLLG